MSHSSTSGRSRVRRFRRGSSKTSPPVRTLCASARRRSTRGPRPRTQRRVRRSPGRPFEPVHRGAGQRDLVRRELREVLVRQRLRIAPGLQDAATTARRCPRRTVSPWLSRDAGAPVRWSSVRGSSAGRCRVWRHQAVVLAPERVEGAVEHREVVAAMHQQRAARVVHVVARRRGSRAAAPRRCRGGARRAPPGRARAAAGRRREDCRGGRPWRGSHRDAARATRLTSALAPDRVDVVLRLERDAERRFDDVGVQRVLVERRQRRHPVERLGHARQLVQLHRSQPLHERRHLRGEAR